MNAIGDGWEMLPVSSFKSLSPRSNILMAGLGCDELVIIGGRGIEGYSEDGYILEIPKMRFKTVIIKNDESKKFAAFKNSSSMKISDSKVAWLTFAN